MLGIQKEMDFSEISRWVWERAWGRSALEERRSNPWKAVHSDGRKRNLFGRWGEFTNATQGEESWLNPPRGCCLSALRCVYIPKTKSLCISSVQFSCSVVSNSLQPHEPQHARPPCPSPTPGVHPNPCPLSRWCHPTISSSVISFSSRLQSFPASGSFPVSQFFASGGQSIGVSASASVLPMNIKDWSPLGWTGWISLQSTGLSRVFSNTTAQKHQFFGIQPFL